MLQGETYTCLPAVLAQGEAPDVWSHISHTAMGTFLGQN